jgi:hypothetical protein
MPIESFVKSRPLGDHMTSALGSLVAPLDLAGFIDAMRWGAVTSADPNRYQAPFWSGAAVEAYQLEPLRRALASPRANLLLALYELA